MTFNKFKYISSQMIVLLLSMRLFAGNTGKIMGVVTDKQSKEPLIGVNIIVKGTSLGAATDLNGTYYILQVPPGTFSLEVSYIGYHTITVTDIKVNVDLTSQVDIQMESKAIEYPTIVVTADQKIVQKDITSTRRIATDEEIKSTPGIESTTDIFRLIGGATIRSEAQTIELGNGTQLQVRDESLKDIHIRGGRGGEILYMVDGMPVTHPIYGGRDVLDLNVEDIDAMELLTGAFNAEYGQAQSGVVNITTRSGSKEFKGGVEYKTTDIGLLQNSYNSQYTSIFLSGPEMVTGSLLPKLGLRVPGAFSYFISANGNLSNTQYNNHRSRGTISLLGIDLDEKQDNKANINSKITWDISKSIRAVLNYHGSWHNWSSYSWYWKNYPDHTPEYVRNNQNLSLQFNHTLSKSTFYSLSLGYLSVAYNASLDGKNPTEFWTFYKDGVGYDYETYMNLFSSVAPDYYTSSIKSPATDSYGFYDVNSYNAMWRDDKTKTVTMKGDITSQIHPEHLIKTGIELSYNDLQYVDIQDGGVTLSNYGLYIFNNDVEYIAPNGPYKEFGQDRWVFETYPVIGSCYIQDKFEKETLIINAGLRLDAFYLGSTIMEDEWKAQWQNATGLEPNWDPIKYKFSPRFGISFPISVKTVLFFSYGHFNQLPELQYYYRDPYTGGFTGNPFLDYEQTILYEFGFTHELIQDWAIDIKSYNKDISKQVGTTQLLASLGLPVYLYDNNGYARAKGLEFELTKNYSHLYSGKITYTMQWANGYSSSAFEDYIRSTDDFPNPIRERRLDWDIRHQIVLQASLAIPKGKNINLFGLKMPDDWSLTILSNFASGSPYTAGTYDDIIAQKTYNLETSSPTMETDLKIKKSFIAGKLNFSIYADVYNLFDRRNVQISYGFNKWTGKPYEYGDVDPQTGNKKYLDWYTVYNLMDPRQYSYGRYAKLGLSIDL